MGQYVTVVLFSLDLGLKKLNYLLLALWLLVIVITRLISFCRDALSPPLSSPAHRSDFPIRSSLDLLSFRTRPPKFGLKKCFAASLFAGFRIG